MLKYIPPYKSQESGSIRTNDERVGVAANENLAPSSDHWPCRAFSAAAGRNIFSLLLSVRPRVDIGDRNFKYFEENISNLIFLAY